ncbi:F0F1 ATP synthase subunit gamma [Bartonella sp. DGB1]|uniref:F0F1 ATP synthase subunit gamma n=1 Tax=Bartonella sp. DGB1 TaxID=3239807 RepID=UPI00352353F6
MASLKELRDRIISVKGTQKITRAMQMVAAAKLRKAKDRAENARPYAQKIYQLVSQLSSTVESSEAPKLLTGNGKDQTHLLVVCTADRGLCGPFNSQIVRFAEHKIKELLAQGRSVKIITVGKKGAELLKKNYSKLIIEELTFRQVKQLDYQQAAEITAIIVKLFNNNQFDVCQLFYSHFYSVLHQEPTVMPIIPLVNDVNLEQKRDNQQQLDKQQSQAININYEYEPNPIKVLNDLVPRNISAQIFSALLENVAGEMGAKMRAMDNATRNAGDMISRLSVTYNRQRQAKITTELIEIISGAEAL